MSIQAGYSATVLEDDGIAITAFFAGERNTTIAGRFDGSSGRR
jgi:hypothetical protein